MINKIIMKSKQQSRNQNELSTFNMSKSYAPKIGSFL